MALEKESELKFTKRTKTPKKIEPVVEEPTHGEIDFDELVTGASAYVKDIFIAKDDSPLLTVNDWITMPKPIRDVTGTKGIPCGMITMAYGKKDCGKTTFATEALVSCQRDGGIPILLDTEHKFSLHRAKAMGLEKPIIIRANTIEEAFDKFVAMINYLKSAQEHVAKKDLTINKRDFAAGEVIPDAFFQEATSQKKNIQSSLKYAHRKICCVWDSLGATPSEAELDENVKDFSMTAAKVIKGRLRKLLYYIRDMKVAFIIINQVYSNMNMFGEKTTPYGGSGPEYHSVIILQFAKLGGVRPPGVKAADAGMCGIKSLIECKKNHLGQPFKKTEVQIDWKGFVVDRDPEYAPEGWGAHKEESDEPSAEVPKDAKKRTAKRDKSDGV